MRLSKRHENLLKHTFIDYQQTSEFLENPIIVNKADGLYYWDLEGKRYFDAIGVRRLQAGEQMRAIVDQWKWAVESGKS